MKRLFIGIFLAAGVLGGAAIHLRNPASNIQTPAQPSVGPLEHAVLSVDDVAARPERFTQQITVRGVVSFVSPKDQMAVLISESEFAKCKTACPEATLPVRWRGELPSVTDLVVVRGGIAKTERGYLFDAVNTEIVESGKSDVQ